MLRNYELTFVVDPRVAEEDVVAMAEDYKRMATAAGGEVVAQQSWGKRKLAYSIDKLTEGRYMLLHLAAEDKNPLLEVELRMRQNDKILRYLTVRTDRPANLSPPSTAEPTPLLLDVVEDEEA